MVIKTKSMFNRSIIVMVLLLSWVSHGKAQIELRSNPFSLIFVSPSLFIEHELSEEISIEVLGGLDNGVAFSFNSTVPTYSKIDAYKFRIAGKYYFNPLRGTDKWFTSALVSYQRSRSTDLNLFAPTGFEFIQNSLTAGFGFGYKFKLRSRLTIEISTGFLRSLYVKRLRTDTNSSTTDQNLSQIFFNTSIGYSFKKKSKSGDLKTSRR